MAVRLILVLGLLGIPLFTSSDGVARQAAQKTAGAPQAAAQTDELAQIRTDLDRMESLNMNMSSEIEFLHDQNLQILLRTNSQMWTVLIRDLRLQIQREEQRRSATPPDRK